MIELDVYFFPLSQNTLFLVLAVALTGTLADVSHLSGIQTVLHEDGYHYDKPSKPFPVSQEMCFINKFEVNLFS